MIQGMSGSEQNRIMRNVILCVFNVAYFIF